MSGGREKEHAGTIPEMFFSQASRLGERPAFLVKRAGRFVPISYGEAGRTVRELAAGLIDLGVITITWKWSPFKELMQNENLDLRRATHEIEDDDPDYDYGEYWEDANPRYIPIEEAST